MASMSTEETKISLKILVRKEQNKVLYAVADSNFVDTLFSMMTLPLATIVRLLGKLPDEKFEAVGSLNNLYQSLKDLPEDYLSTEEGKFMLLNPRTSAYGHCRKLKLNVDDTAPTRYLICENLSCLGILVAFYSTCGIARCSYCGKLMNKEVSFKDSNVSTGADCIGGGVFVPEIASFIVTDDLRVIPNDVGCCLRLLVDLGITYASDLEERTIDVGFEEMIDLLKWALLCKNPLTCLTFSTMNHIRDVVHPQHENFIQQSISCEFATNSKEMTLKVMLQKSTCKLLFAEAEEDFVDFVFGFLAIPLGTLIGKLMNGSSSIKSLDNLFESISNISVGRYMKAQDAKDMVLRPQLEHHWLSRNQLFPLSVSESAQIYYTISSSSVYLWRRRYANNYEVKFKDPMVNGGYLKEPMKYILTDDLVITPLSFSSTIDMLLKLKVPLNDVEEHWLTIGIQEGLNLLKASLKSSSTLTDALLHLIKPSQEA